ncbi:hypothetical protein EB796_022249 [Bugula neritina]|uniref:Uncharacterized protein n=1 Tax=Bugula neritina TaxID=10212 RepID=A0A7J7IZV2_BUGNE|nr:hypothetical protein EB796_022249 [Bugula neritina]
MAFDLSLAALIKVGAMKVYKFLIHDGIMSDTVLAFLPFEPHYYVDTWAYIIILATLKSCTSATYTAK